MPGIQKLTSILSTIGVLQVSLHFHAFCIWRLRGVSLPGPCPCCSADYQVHGNPEDDHQQSRPRSRGAIHEKHNQDDGGGKDIETRHKGISKRAIRAWRIRPLET